MADTDTTGSTPGQEQGTDNVAAAEAAAAAAAEADAKKKAEDDDLPKEVLRDRLTRANEEAAARRINERAQAEEIAALKEQVANAKSMDEVNALLAEHEAKVKAEAERADRAQAALEAGLDKDWLDRIKGDSYEDMLKDAQSLAERIGGGVAQQTPEPRIPGGGRRPAAPPADDDPEATLKRLRDKHSF